MNYDIPTHITYTLPASAIDTIGTKFQIVGPKGLRGRLVSICAVITAGTTVTATRIQLGVTGALEKYGFLVVPIASAGTLANDSTDSTGGVVNDVSENIPADSVTLISSDGGATAGDADLAVTIAWF